MTAIYKILYEVMAQLSTGLFTVVGGSIPLVVLVYLYSKKEKKYLNSHAKGLKETLPMQEKILEKSLEITQKAVEQDPSKGAELFLEYMKNFELVEANKKFIKYVEEYNFLSAVGHILKMNNYVPKSIQEHKDMSR